MSRVKMGRPKNLNNLQKEFLQDYTDPANSKIDLCRKYKLSNATFYRYEKDLDLPKINVGLGASLDFSQKKILTQLKKDSITEYEFNLTRLLCQKLNVRAHIYFAERPKIISETQKGRFDFSLASASWTPLRSEKLSFSNSYHHKIHPTGAIFTTQRHLDSLGPNKPKLGVIKDGVHADYANHYLKQEWQQKKFTSYKHMLYDFKRRSLSSILIYPGLAQNSFRLFPATSLLKISKNLIYKSFTGVIASRKNDFWIPLINQELAKIFEENLISDYSFPQHSIGF